MNIYMKWLLIVSLNAVVGFYLGKNDCSAVRLAGMSAGIISWYFAYVLVDGIT